MRDFKWLTAIVSEKCSICFNLIRQGDGFYYESRGLGI
jgi:hypothetical protein